jgi:hypothetical protein
MYAKAKTLRRAKDLLLKALPMHRELAVFATQDATREWLRRAVPAAARLGVDLLALDVRRFPACSALAAGAPVAIAALPTMTPLPAFTPHACCATPAATAPLPLLALPSTFLELVPIESGATTTHPLLAPASPSPVPELSPIPFRPSAVREQRTRSRSPGRVDASPAPEQAVFKVPFESPYAARNPFADWASDGLLGGPFGNLLGEFSLA